jgi:DNA primase
VGLFPQQFIDDLRLQASILTVVQEYVPLKKAGNSYKGNCPFHNEKTPSFHVHPDKGFFHCFGCGVGGDVFKFLELHEKVGFQDAVRILAQKFGVAIPESDGASDDSRRDSALRESLLKVHEIAGAYFREQLAAPVGGRARAQLAERGVSAETIEQLGLGFAPSAREGLKARLLTQGFSQALLLQSGLLAQRDTGESVDRFRNRLMVPICRDTGSVIAFGGRQMDPDQGGPKYLNSPETAIYSKGRTLYGLNLTKKEIQKSGFAVLVEGYFDFAQIFQSKAAPVVASCGTALTPEQARLLHRFTKRVVLSFDPDPAGQGASTKSCQLLVSEGFDVNVVVVDKGEDPDTFIRRHGGAEYVDRLRGSKPFLEYVARTEASAFDLRSVSGQNEYLTKMMAFSQVIPENTGKQVFAEKVAGALGITSGEVLAQFRKSFVSNQGAAKRVLLSFGDLKKAEKDLIWALIHDVQHAMAALATLDIEDLEGLAGRDIFELARSLHGQPIDVLPSALLERLTDVRAQIVRDIATNPGAPPFPAMECAQALKRQRLERDRAAIKREIDRLQELGAREHGAEIDTLSQRLLTVAVQLDRDVTGARD